ncbi:MAG: peroxiredoxin [Candidatus Thorarchaeota archaeon]|nr:peroxiredoxin [Candidatus Thorarchaeota archaeon]
MLKVGESIPDFETTDEAGNPFRLSDQVGHKFVIYFYPKDDTPGCTAEACSIRDNYHVFEDSGIPIFGVSGGSVESHRKFKEKYSLNFPLLMDEDYSIAKLFRVYHPIKLLGKELLGVKRVTYLIDETRKVEAIFGGPEGLEKVNTKQHADQIVKHWGLKL